MIETAEYAPPLVQALLDERDRRLRNACRLQSRILDLEGGRLRTFSAGTCESTASSSG